MTRLISATVVLTLLACIPSCNSDSNPVVPVPARTSVSVAYFGYLDLDSDSVEAASNLTGLPPSAAMDILVAYRHDTTPHTLVLQRAGREIAHLVGLSFESVQTADADMVTFSAFSNVQPFGIDRTILLKTEMGAVYKLGNPVEAANPKDGVTFEYAKLRDAP